MADIEIKLSKAFLISYSKKDRVWSDVCDEIEEGIRMLTRGKAAYRFFLTKSSLYSLRPKIRHVIMPNGQFFRGKVCKRAAAKRAEKI